MPKKNVWLSKQFAYNKFLYWPLTEEQYLKWQKPAKILLRIKIITFISISISVYSYFSLGRMDKIVLGTSIGGVLGAVFGLFFYYAVKSGRIQFGK